MLSLSNWIIVVTSTCNTSWLTNFVFVFVFFFGNNCLCIKGGYILWMFLIFFTKNTLFLHRSIYLFINTINNVDNAVCFLHSEGFTFIALCSNVIAWILQPSGRHGLVVLTVGKYSINRNINTIRLFSSIGCTN